MTTEEVGQEVAAYLVQKEAALGVLVAAQELNAAIVAAKKVRVEVTVQASEFAVHIKTSVTMTSSPEEDLPF